MQRTLPLALIASLTGAASAAPFEILSYEAGGGIPGITGDGIIVSTGTFFNTQPINYRTHAQPASTFGAGNFSEFDSYFAIDGFGPSARNRSFQPANNSHATLAFYGDYGPPGGAAADYDVGELVPGGAFVMSPGNHIGNESGDPISTPPNRARGAVAFSPPPIRSGFAPNATGGRSTRDGIFLGRFTVQAGATLSGSLLLSTTDPSSPLGFDSAIVTIRGPGVLMGTTSGPQLIAISAVPLFAGLLRGSPLDITVPTLDEEEPFGLADVYDFWAREVPTPAGVALLPLAAAIGAARVPRRGDGRLPRKTG